MATKKERRTHADGAETAGNLQAAWPFPKATKGELPAEAAPMATGERIHVAEVQLYTDPTQNTVAIIAIEQLVESPFNPRTRFDGLQEMAETMKAVGVMQPILVRPVTLPGGFEIRKGDEPQQAYEIVYGHRRFRSAKLAGLATMPAIVRELTDAQAAQLQAIENVQRKDLDPIEEAVGYQHYLDAHGVTKDQLAAEIGLSRSHVYSRLKLLNAVPTVQEALRAGEIGAEVALLVARIHLPKLQEKALAAIKGKYYDMEDGGAKSFRQIRSLLAEKFTLELKGALFDTTSEDLVPLAGSCTSCNKRTGNAPEYGDMIEKDKEYWSRAPVGTDVCTDPDCFETKKKAHLAIKAGELEAKGKTVIAGHKARNALTANGDVKGAYVELKDVRKALSEAKKAGKGAEVKTVVIQNPRDGKTKEAVAVADLVAAGVIKEKKAPTQETGRRDSKRDEEERAKQLQQEELTKRVNRALLHQVRAACAGRPLTELALRLVTERMFEHTDWGDRQLLAELHQFKSPHELAAKVATLPADRLATLLLDCVLIDGVVPYFTGDTPDALLAMAKECDIDVKAIRKEIAKQPVDDKTQDLLPQQDEEEEAEEA